MKRRKIDILMIHSKTELQKVWCGYCTFNILFLFLFRVVFKVDEKLFLLRDTFEYWQLFFVAIMLFAVYVYVMIAYLYCIFLLPYLHIALGVGFIIFAVNMLIKEKNIKRFLLALVLTVASMTLNISWIVQNYENILTNYLALQ